MDKLTPDELMALMRLPPYIVDWDELIEKYYGDVPPENINEFLADVCRVHDNLTMLQRKREKEEEEEEVEEQKKSSDGQTCDKCDSIRDSLVDAIKMHTNRLSTAFKNLLFDFFQLQRELRGNRDIYILDDQLDKALYEIDALCGLTSKLKEQLSNEKEPTNPICYMSM